VWCWWWHVFTWTAMLEASVTHNCAGYRYATIVNGGIWKSCITLVCQLVIFECRSRERSPSPRLGIADVSANWALPIRQLVCSGFQTKDTAVSQGRASPLRSQACVRMLTDPSLKPTSRTELQIRTQQQRELREAEPLDGTGFIIGNDATARLGALATTIHISRQKQQ
jgi:hypothetical protein